MAREKNFCHFFHILSKYQIYSNKYIYHQEHGMHEIESSLEQIFDHMREGGVYLGVKWQIHFSENTVSANKNNFDRHLWASSILQETSCLSLVIFVVKPSLSLVRVQQFSFILSFLSLPFYLRSTNLLGRWPIDAFYQWQSRRRTTYRCFDHDAIEFPWGISSKVQKSAPWNLTGGLDIIVSLTLINIFFGNSRQ